MVVYVQDHVSWGVADIVLTAVMAVSLAIFIIGRRNYRYQKPTGSPLTPMLQVLVAAIAKRSLPHPSDPAQLPGMISINLDLKRGGNGSFFLKTAAYGHFGRDDPDFTWEFVKPLKWDKPQA
ncbi:hypothetical protein ACFXTH_015273 [Malus domestica]